MDANSFMTALMKGQNALLWYIVIYVYFLFIDLMRQTLHLKMQRREDSTILERRDLSLWV